uniref:Cdpk1 n=1 Tax=Arundo donax TaxID=35708 RepID=A0A0A9H6V5_ARUDO
MQVVPTHAKTQEPLIPSLRQLNISSEPSESCQVIRTHL